MRPHLRRGAAAPAGRLGPEPERRARAERAPALCGAR